MSTTLNDIIKEYRNCKFYDANKARWASMGDIGELCNIGTDFAANNMFSRAVDCWTYIMENEDEVPTEIYVNLGVSYYYGNGVRQDYEKAVRYYQFAADKDHPWAQYNLAVAYEYGKGIQRDINKAISYYWKAAEQGINEAIDALSRLGVYNELYLSFLPRSFKDKCVVRNYDTLLSQKSKTTELSFDVIRETSNIFYNEYSKELQASLYDDLNHGCEPLNSEPHMYAYMFALGKMHNAKLRTAYSHLSPEFFQNETIDIVDYGCGQAMGCICYADFLREKGIRQKVRRVVLIEPSELALKRAALHVSLMFSDAELRTVCKGFDDLLPEDLCSDTDTPTLHILSNVLDIGDRYYDLNKFADLVANTIAGYNEFVCVEPLFCTADIDSRPARFFERLRIEPYFRFSAGKGAFVPDKDWTCAILLGTVDKAISSQGVAVVCQNNKWSIVDISGRVITTLKYNDTKHFSDEGLVRVELNGKWGLINSTGKELCSPKYDEIGIFHKGLAQIKLNGKWGLIDSTGKEVVLPKYDKIEYFWEQGRIIRIELHGKWGFIDSAGKEIVPPKYDYIDFFHDGIARIELHGKWGFINSAGKETIPPKYDHIKDFYEGLAAIELLNSKWIVIDRTGKEVVPPKYDEILDFHEGLVGFKLNGKWGFIDSDGKEVVPPKYNRIGNFHEGLAGFVLNSKCGVIDRNGKEVIPPKYDVINDFHKGFAGFSLNGECGVIDTSGKEVVPPGNYEIYHYHEGLWEITWYGFLDNEGNEISKKWAIIDKTGQIVNHSIYNEIEPFNEGLARIELNDKWGFIDKTGKEVIPPEYNRIGNFHEGLAEVRLNGKWGIINLKGEIVVPAKYDKIYLIR